MQRFLGLLFLLLAAPALPAAPGFQSDSRIYACAGDVRLPVLYLNTSDGQSFATLYFDGKLSLLRAFGGASGVAYASVDEELGLRWRTKGDEATLSFLAADHMAREKWLLRDCRSLPRK